MLENKGTRILDFYADWCQPCQRIKPFIDKLEAEYDVPVLKIDADESVELIRKFNVSGLPTVLLVDNDDNIIKAVNGVKPKSVYEDLFELSKQF
jgi:thioredoxin 1